MNKNNIRNILIEIKKCKKIKYNLESPFEFKSYQLLRLNKIIVIRLTLFYYYKLKRRYCIDLFEYLSFFSNRYKYL